MLAHNLLPDTHKKRMRQETIARVFVAASIMVGTWLFLLGAVLGGIRVVMLVNQSIAEAQLEIEREGADTQEAEAFENKITEFNATLKRIKDIQEAQRYDVYSLLNTSAALMPKGANLTRVTLDAQKGALNLQGNADFRTQVVALQDALEGEPSFAEVSAPLSNLQKARDIDFIFDITLASAQEDDNGR